jgi:maltooligosyltrehalose trehalohydrolase
MAKTHLPMRITRQSVKTTIQPSPGATITDEGVHYCVWAPAIKRVSVEIESADRVAKRTLILEKQHAGYHRGLDAHGKAGDAYAYRLDAGPPLPDPASRGQESDVHGRSLVVDPKTYQWEDAGWKRPRFRDLVIYELHLGTFTAEGTFRSAIAKLPHFERLGVNAIELMPVAAFPGNRNWGYDGVLPYAPARCYGTPDDLRMLVDAAHAQGMAVLLDVVYNHFGPDGNYLSAFSQEYSTDRHHTPWGSAFNFDSEMSTPVREFLLRNPAYWMEEFHIDGFRFDATHEIKDDSEPHILAEMTQTVHARGGYAIAEDSRHEPGIVTASSEGGLGFDAVWADDFHHSARVSQTQERWSYFENYKGTIEELVLTLRCGWLPREQPADTKEPAGEAESALLPPQRFLHCISNHDQTGNRARGERLNHLVSAEAYRALSVLLCLTPYTPLFFMGQEWAASSPFLYFTDHHAALGRMVTQGRRKEFAAFPEYSDRSIRKRIPDPQARKTFEQSKLKWRECETGKHALVFDLYRECLRLRQGVAAFRPMERKSWRSGVSNWGSGWVDFGGYLMLFAVSGGPAGELSVPGRWSVLLSSEESRFGGSGETAFKPETGEVKFRSPETLLFQKE